MAVGFNLAMELKDMERLPESPGHTFRMIFEYYMSFQYSFTSVLPDVSSAGRDRAPDHQDERDQVHDYDHDGDGEQPVRWEGRPDTHYQAGAQDRVDKSNRMLDDPGINDPVNAQSDTQAEREKARCAQQ